MAKVKVFIKGDEIKALYNDSFSILQIADNIIIERASDVFWDEAYRRWRVKISATGEVLNESFEKRGDAIAFEVKVLEERIRNGFDRVGITKSEK